jgi:hypothetical protein
MMNKTREERKEITNKAIEVAGNRISKVINPLTISPIDITQLIQSLIEINKITKEYFLCQSLQSNNS